MLRHLYIFLILLMFASCGIQRKLNRRWSGKPVSELTGQFGEPVAITTSSGDSVYIFEQTERLHSTEIDQGKLTLDPIVTPKVTKTKRFYFNVKNGSVVKVRLEEEYSR